MSHRREVLKQIAIGAGALTMGKMQPAPLSQMNAPHKTEKNIQHSVCKWCFNDVSLEELIEHVQDMGISSIELTTPKDWPILQAKGMTCAMGTDGFISLTEGFNNPLLHKKLQAGYQTFIDQAADAGIEQIICFSGNRNGLTDEAGLENCAIGLEPLVKQSEKRGIKLVMELLNSRVDHKDYQCDNSPWGVALVEKLGSPHFRLLYDIYHMQIMEGNVIATIRKNAAYYSHYHTAGVPGRHEFDESQELYYPAIMKAITETGYKGFVGQEFMPQRADRFGSLRRAVEMCSY